MDTSVESHPGSTTRLPDTPSKWDVIPIHNSDRSTFKSCRRKWDWSSPARNNLSVRADVNGVYIPFFFGTGIHYALENFYNPGLRRDPVESFKTWFHIQWYGGVVTSDWLDKVYDLAPTIAGEPGYHVGPREDYPLTYQVRGLVDILPDAEFFGYDELLDLGVNMLENYKRYAEVNDDFEVLVAEHDFSIPVWDFENDCILKRHDLREQSPNYGKLLEVHARGRVDLLGTRPTGKLCIVDHKTAEKLDSSEQMDTKLEADEQVTTYLYTTEVEASYYDLPHKGQPVEELIYNVLRKTYPQPPTIVRGGLFSIDRTKESTTYDMLVEWIESAQIATETLSEKHQAYIDWLREVGDEQFFVRKLVRRNRHQLKNAGYRIYLEALDMLDPDLRIYPNLSKDWSCLNCAFRPPCMAIESGEDANYLLNTNYARTKDR